MCGRRYPERVVLLSDECGQATSSDTADVDPIPAFPRMPGEGVERDTSKTPQRTNVPLIAGAQVHHAVNRLTFLKPFYFLRDLFTAFAWQRHCRDVRRDGDARIAPERVAVGERLGAENIERGTTDVTGLDEADQIRLNQLLTAPHIDEVSGWLKFAEVFGVKNAIRIRRERQHAHEYAHVAEELAKLARAREGDGTSERVPRA